MLQFNPFCDNDFRNGLTLLAGISLMFLTFSAAIDISAITEVIVYSDYWDHIQPEFPIRSAVFLLGIDLFIILLQIYYGIILLVALFDNNFMNCRKWYYPSLLLYAMELLVLLIYVASLPSSPYFYYFISFSLTYKAYLFWPVKRYLEDEPITNIIVNERTRLIRIRPVNHY